MQNVRNTVKTILKFLLPAKEQAAVKRRLFYFYSWVRGVLMALKSLVERNCKRLPRVIQLPITNRCNLNCKMCGIPNIRKKDVELSVFKKAVCDKLFRKVVSVGINGGEPFLLNDLEQRLEILFLLPRLKSVNIISNGVLTDRILTKLEAIYCACKSRQIRVSITFSLDGFREVHDNIRGLPGAFDRTVQTIKIIQNDMKRYCDNIGIICTISTLNIIEINELVAFAKINGLPMIDYQLAVTHKRLHNDEKMTKLSVLSNEYLKTLAMEFFLRLYRETHKNKYYYIFEFLKNGGKGRMMTCPWIEREVTLDADGNIFYCAVESRKIGSVLDGSLKKQFFDKKNIEYRKSIAKEKCDRCIHYSSSTPFFRSYISAAEFEYAYFFDIQKYMTGSNKE